MIFDIVTDFLFPKVCIICNTYGSFICKTCFNQIKFIEGARCPKCSIPYPYDEVSHLCIKCIKQKRSFDKLVSLFSYEGYGKIIIEKIKFSGYWSALEALSEKIIERFEIDETDNINSIYTFSRHPEFDFITYVPTTNRRLIEKNYNLPKKIAKFLGKLLKKPVVCSITKVRETERQMNLPLNERENNLRGAFSKKVEAKGKSIILVDDIATTCATVDECSKTLKKAGAEYVLVFTLARTPKF